MSGTLKHMVTIDYEGELRTHIGFTVGSYATICGMDGNDAFIGQQTTIETPAGAKLDCPQCYAMWAEARKWKVIDFDIPTKTKG